MTIAKSSFEELVHTIETQKAQIKNLESKIKGQDAIITERNEVITDQSDVITEQNATIQKQSSKILELLRRLGLNSENSSKPPSTDHFKEKSPHRARNNREKTEQKCGGQKGHKGETLKKVSHPDQIVEHMPESCSSCGKSLDDVPVAENFESRQVFDIPAPKPVVTEHQVFTKLCSCGHKNKALFPDFVKAPAQYGSNIQAAAVYLSSAQFIPEERLQESLQALFGLGPSTATLVAMKSKIAENLAPIMDNIQDSIRAADVKHLDETGLKIGGKLSWMHVSSTETCTHYRVDKKRGDLPQGIQGFVIHDHWKPYYKLENVQHVLCNAHHLRELKALSEIEKEPWAISMGKLLRWMLKLSHKFKHYDQSIPERFLKKILDKYDQIVREGLSFHESQTPMNSLILGQKSRGRVKKRIGHNLLIRLKDYKEDTLRFLWEPSVSFTNNLAERDLRMVKVKQKISGGFRTLNGANEFAILRGFLSSAKKQNLNLLIALSNPQLLAT